MKNPSAVTLGKRSADARRKKLGVKAFRESMRQLALKRAAKNKVQIIPN